MLFNLFTKYLAENDKITDSQISELNDYQKKNRVKLGLIAVAEKMITEKQADEINRKQALEDKRFGDIAVELGYLSGEQIGKLLDLQGNPYMKICQGLTELGMMEMNDIEDAFKGFVKEIGAKDEDIDALKSDDVDKYTSLYLPDINASYADLALICVRTINRIISTDLSLEKATIVNSLSVNSYALQEMNGDKKIITGMFSDGDAILKIADGYANESFGVVDEDSLDSVGEFINIINGLYATSLSYAKCNVELAPPNYSVGDITINADEICVLPVTIEGKTLRVFISVK